MFAKMKKKQLKAENGKGRMKKWKSFTLTHVN
jgi:hypothetical protein